MKVRFSHLSLSERRKIERWRQMKLSPDEMARRLGRHRSTIFRELRRNHFHDSDIPKLSGYWCVVAQSYSDGRRTRQRKLVRDPDCATRSSVVSALAGPPSRSPAGCATKVPRAGSAKRRSINTSTQRTAAKVSCGVTCPPAGGGAGATGCASARRPNLRRNSASCSGPTLSRIAGSSAIGKRIWCCSGRSMGRLMSPQ